MVEKNIDEIEGNIMTINDTLLKIKQIQLQCQTFPNDIVSVQEKAFLNLQFQALQQAMQNQGDAAPNIHQIVANIKPIYDQIHQRGIVKKNNLINQLHLKILEMFKDLENIEHLREKAEKVAEKVLVFTKCKQTLFDGSEAGLSDKEESDNELIEKQRHGLEM